MIVNASIACIVRDEFVAVGNAPQRLLAPVSGLPSRLRFTEIRITVHLEGTGCSFVERPLAFEIPTSNAAVVVDLSRPWTAQAGSHSGT